MKQDMRVADELTFAQGIKTTIAAALSLASLFAIVGSLDAETTTQRLYYLLMGLGVGAIMPVTFVLSWLLTLPTAGPQPRKRR